MRKKGIASLLSVLFFVTIMTDWGMGHIKEGKPLLEKPTKPVSAKAEGSSIGHPRAAEGSCPKEDGKRVSLRVTKMHMRQNRAEARPLRIAAHIGYGMPDISLKIEQRKIDEDFS